MRENKHPYAQQWYCARAQCHRTMCLALARRAAKRLLPLVNEEKNAKTGGAYTNSGTLLVREISKCYISLPRRPLKPV
jgi:hypothetical protein